MKGHLFHKVSLWVTRSAVTKKLSVAQDTHTHTYIAAELFMTVSTVAVWWRYAVLNSARLLKDVDRQFSWFLTQTALNLLFWEYSDKF